MLQYVPIVRRCQSFGAFGFLRAIVFHDLQVNEAGLPGVVLTAAAQRNPALAAQRKCRAARPPTGPDRQPVR
jgi:hypothetical protein